MTNINRPLSAILADLPPDDRAVIAAALAGVDYDGAQAREIRQLQAEVERLRPPPSREKLRDQRDEAIRQALLAFYGNLKPRPAAEAFAADLDRYLATAWPREREIESLPASVSAHRRSLHNIARLNCGRSLSWRQLMNIRDGCRSSTL